MTEETNILKLVTKDGDAEPVDNNSWKYALFDVLDYITYILNCEIDLEDIVTIEVLESLRGGIIDQIAEGNPAEELDLE